MSMTRRDWVEIAAVLKSEVADIEGLAHLDDDEKDICTETVQSIASKIGRKIESRNPVFDYGRFMDDCGVFVKGQV